MLINVSTLNGICEIRLNRPEVFNSFNKEMAFQLQNILDTCSLFRGVSINAEDPLIFPTQSTKCGAIVS